MEILVRSAVEGDFEPLCEVIDQVDRLHAHNVPWRFRRSEGPARSRNFILNAINSPDAGLLIAETEDTLLGFVHAIVKNTPDVPIFVPHCFAVVENLAVRDTFRRSGVGRALMDRVRDWAISKGADSIVLNVYAFNESAIAFYRGLGYEILSYRMIQQL